MCSYTKWLFRITGSGDPKSGACKNSVSNPSTRDEGKLGQRDLGTSTYLRIQIIQVTDGSGYIPSMDGALNLLPGHNRLILQLSRKVGFGRELLSGVGVTGHGQVIEDQGIDVTGWFCHVSFGGTEVFAGWQREVWGSVVNM